MTELQNPFLDLGVNRRTVLGGAAAGAVGLAANTISPTKAAAQTGGLDLSKPEDNLTALLKLQADLSGEQVVGGFKGYAWAWIPDEGNHKIFGTYGIGCSRLVWDEENQQYNFHHREVLYYTDPVTGDVLDTWHNPITDRKVEVLHILNDPVNRIYSQKPGPFAPPYPNQTVGDDVVFQIDVFRATDRNPMKRKDYPLHAQQDLYQSAELWGIYGRKSEIDNPDVTSASSHTAWGRVGMWLPFMEMGNRPGVMVYHSQSFKMMDGIAGIEKKYREYTEANYPKYLEAPTEWTGLRQNENTWSYSQKEIEKRRAEGRTGSVFGAEG
jgi:hypothetical protein